MAPNVIAHAGRSAFDGFLQPDHQIDPARLFAHVEPFQSHEQSSGTISGRHDVPPNTGSAGAVLNGKPA
jgi:hypothetical protein